MMLGENSITAAIINLEHDQVSFYVKQKLPGPYNSQTPVVDLVQTIHLTPDSTVRSSLMDFLQEAMGSYNREHKKGAS